MFRFADPFYFFLLIPVGFAAWFIYRRRITNGMVFSPVHRLPAIATWRTYASAVLPLFLVAGLTLSVVALARPQRVFEKSRRTSDVVAIEMVTDVSGSMEALDMSTRSATGDVKYRRRVDAVKETFAEFVTKRSEDLIGLVTFGGFASTRSPLTADHQALLHVLKGVDVPKPGLNKDGQIVNQEELLTAIGDAVATACARLENAEPKTKIIVLLSDGESNTGIIKPEEAIKIAKKMGIKVYTIGIGSTGTAPFRVKDFFGRDVIQYAQVSLDEDLLKSIAKSTGGRYFNVTSPKGLDDAMEDINKLEKTRIQKDIYNQYNELFPWLLVPALGLIILGTGLNVLVSKRIT